MKGHATASRNPSGPSQNRKAAPPRNYAPFPTRRSRLKSESAAAAAHGASSDASDAQAPTAHRTSLDGSLDADTQPAPGDNRLRTSAVLLKRLQFLAGLKSDRLAGRNRHFGAGARIAADARLPWAHVENPEAAQLDPLALSERPLHAFKHRFDRHLRLRLGNAGSVDHFINDVEFDQSRLLSPLLPRNLMIGLGLSSCQAQSSSPTCFAAPARSSRPASRCSQHGA